MRRNEGFHNLVAAWADSEAPDLSSPIMAMDVGYRLNLYVDLFEATGEPRWIEKARSFADRAAEAFVHPSGLIAGTTGLRRPQYYDTSHGSAMLAAAFHRLGLVEAGLAAYDVRVNGRPEGYPHVEEGHAIVTCRFLGDGPARADIVLESGIASGRQATLRGERGEDGVWRFALVADRLKGERVVRFRVLPDGRDVEIEAVWRYLPLGPERPAFVIGDLDLGIAKGSYPRGGIGDPRLSRRERSRSREHDRRARPRG